MTSPWTGQGLPPVAQARMAEIKASGTWSSALTTDEFATIKSVGFDPVGQVLGAAVYNIGYRGGYGCPSYAYFGTYSRFASWLVELSGCGNFGVQFGLRICLRADGADLVRGQARGDRPDGGRVRGAGRAWRGRGAPDDRTFPCGRPGVQGHRHGGQGAGGAAAAAAVHLRCLRSGLRQADRGRRGACRPGAGHLGRRAGTTTGSPGTRPAAG